MSGVTIHVDDTIALEASLPRDLTGASVTLLVGSDESQTAAAVVEDESSGEVAVPLSTLDVPAGATEIKWRITFADGTVEKLPPEGDEVFAYD